MVTTTQLAFNSYTVREMLAGPQDIKSTFERLRGSGYEAVELDLDRLFPLMDVAELKDILDDIGMTAFSAHTKFENLEREFSRSVSNFKTLGLEYVVVPTLPGERFCKDEQGWLTGTVMLASIGKKLSREGIKFAYHNHSKEFEKFGSKRAMEIVFDEENWSDYLVEIDTCWVQHAGADPAQWIRKYNGRVPLIHVKDLGIIENKPVTMEVGNGNMNWSYILDASRISGVEWYIVEQDDCLIDPVESLTKSKAFLSGVGIF